MTFSGHDDSTINIVLGLILLLLHSTLSLQYTVHGVYSIHLEYTRYYRDCLPVPGIVSGATAAGLSQLNTDQHSITPCSALAVSDERGRTVRLLVIKVRSHHATPMPTTLADGLLADRLQAGRSCL